LHRGNTTLVTSPFFEIEKAAVGGGIERGFCPRKPLILIMLHGRAQLRANHLAEPIMLTPGQTALLPASVSEAICQSLSPSQWLEVSFPADH
jgi:hypothetical protein